MTAAQRLLHRWFVEFNPLYLVSATFVLGGCFVLSQGIANGESLWATLGITAVSEAYALSLIGGAALLVRIDRRRPAVLLALLALLYLWDLTLSTETSAYLGGAGWWVAAGWLALFGIKLVALAWAMRVRLARRVVVAGLLAAGLLAMGPRVVGELGARRAGELLAVAAFALGALYRRSGGIESTAELTAWGVTVLGRVTRAAWWLSGALLGVHVLFWSSSHAIALAAVVPVFALIRMQSVRSEARAWTIALGTLAATALVLPYVFAVTALLTGAALVLRALSWTFKDEAAGSSPSAEAAQSPYRWAEAASAGVPTHAVPVAARVGEEERLRAFTGAVFSAYLAAWTWSWSGGAWPAHTLVLDGLVTAAALLSAWRLRARFPLVPLGATYAHLAAQVVPPPRTAVQWGVTAVVLGFGLLFGSLAITYRMRASTPPSRAVSR
jgi:hypothetical protein